MKICKVCKVKYSDDNNFCEYCEGSQLVPYKEDTRDRSKNTESYDNHIIGRNNAVRAKDIVSGHKETISGYKEIINGSKEVVGGDKETINGHKETVSGHKETVYGDKEVIGHKENIGGNKEVVNGDKNIVYNHYYNVFSQGATPNNTDAEAPQHSNGPLLKDIKSDSKREAYINRLNNICIEAEGIKPTTLQASIMGRLYIITISATIFFILLTLATANSTLWIFVVAMLICSVVAMKKHKSRSLENESQFNSIVAKYNSQKTEYIQSNSIDEKIKYYDDRIADVVKKHNAQCKQNNLKTNIIIILMIVCMASIVVSTTQKSMQQYKIENAASHE